MLSVNGPGISDPLLFDTVINIPTDPNIGNRATIGGVSGETVQLNVAEGGSVGFAFEALSGSEVNLSGGEIATSFDAGSGSEANISGCLLYTSDAADE